MVCNANLATGFRNMRSPGGGAADTGKNARRYAMDINALSQMTSLAALAVVKDADGLARLRRPGAAAGQSVTLLPRGVQAADKPEMPAAGPGRYVDEQA